MSEYSLLDIPVARSSAEKDKAKLDKLKSSAPKKAAKPVTLLDKLNVIEVNLKTHLGKFSDKVSAITDIETLHKYIDKCIENGIVAIDTETVKGELGETALDPVTCQLAGVCLYTPNEKAVYIPVNHRSYLTQQRLPNQLTEVQIAPELERLRSLKIVTHYGKYDMRVLYWTCGIKYFDLYWDTQLGAKVINENESAQLKYLYATKIEGKEKSYDFESIFKGIDFRLVPVQLAMLYAATDPLITYELMLYQKNILDKPENEGPRNILLNIEVPIIKVCAGMEDTGVSIDLDYAKELSVEYTERSKGIEEKIALEVEKFKPQIDAFRDAHPDLKIDDPLSFNSPSQLAILLYDIMGVKVVDPEKPRGTGEEILKEMKLPLCDLILEYRGVQKLLSTYIDKLPNALNKKTDRIHATFNQYGAETGRFSSNDPNLQNIPSHEERIRRMFRAGKGKAFVGGDFSQQEPRLLAQFSGDENLWHAYNENKDLYAWSASLVYKIPYEDCKEFYPNGERIYKKDEDHWEKATPDIPEDRVVVVGEQFDENGNPIKYTNHNGKALRSKMKAIVLGIMYSKGVKAIAEDLKITPDDAQNLFNTFFKEFPKVKQFIDDAQNQAKTYGYVTTLWGRRRHLEDMMLPQYEFETSGPKIKNFNPLFIDLNIKQVETDVVKKYREALNNCKDFRKKQQIKEDALKEGVKIKDNGGFISKASRQCCNSKIQGSAADQTKLAMIKINNDPRLQELGFQLVMAIHDEVIGECPIENAIECGEILSTIMKEAGKPVLSIPQKVDVERTLVWYGEDIAKTLLSKKEESQKVGSGV